MFEPVLARLQAQSELSPHGERVRLLPVAYEERPFSHLLRVGVCLEGAASPGRFLFVKLFKPKPEDRGGDKMRRRVARDFEVSRHIFTALNSANGAAAVRPIACYADQLAIVSEQADGRTLMEHIDDHVRWFPGRASQRRVIETMEAVGRWLRAFQAIETPDGSVSLTDLREYVDVRLRRLLEHGECSGEFRERVLLYLERLAANVADGELAQVLIHADLALGNVLVAGTRVIVLDFAMVQRGCALHDLTRLYTQLDVLRAKPQFRRGVVRELQAGLLRGFDARLNESRSLFRFLSMFNRINHLSTLALKRERFPASAFSRRVRRLHEAWIAKELDATPVRETQ